MISKKVDQWKSGSVDREEDQIHQSTSSLIHCSLSQAAFWTFPDRRQRVQTWMIRGARLMMARTRWMLG